ncbi:hypothetical protein LguiA_002542 [Lonicera macranthoides]
MATHHEFDSFLRKMDGMLFHFLGSQELIEVRDVTGSGTSNENTISFISGLLTTYGFTFIADKFSGKLGSSYGPSNGRHVGLDSHWRVSPRCGDGLTQRENPKASKPSQSPPIPPPSQPSVKRSRVGEVQALVGHTKKCQVLVGPEIPLGLITEFEEELGGDFTNRDWSWGTGDYMYNPA